MNPLDDKAPKPGVDVVQTMQPSSDVLDSVPLDRARDYLPPAPKKSIWRKIILPTMFSAIVLVSLLLVLDVMTHHTAKTPAQPGLTNTSANLKAQSTQLGTLGKQLAGGNVSSPSTLTVNGQLAVSNSLVLSPSTKPNNPVPGEIYYNEISKQPQYYNGTTFVNLQPGGNVTNNVTNVTNNYATSAASSGGAPAIPSNLVTGNSGTSGDLAMFTSGSTLGNSDIKQSGTTITVGGATINVGNSSNSESVAVGSLSGTSATNIQAGSNGLALMTGPVSGTSGTITIASGASSTTAAGDVNIDTGSSVVNGTVVSDKGFEDGLDNMCGNYGAVPTQSTAEVHSGTYSLALTAPVAGNGWELADCEPFDVQVTAGHTYLYSSYVRAATNVENLTVNAYFSCDVFQCETGFSQVAAIADTTTGWTHITGILVAPPGSNFVQFQIFGNTTVNNEVMYLDDYTVTDLSSSAAVSSLNLGTVNAQEVTIGNSAEIGPTKILGAGSGVDISTGVGSVAVTAADLTLQSAGGFTALNADTNTGDIVIDTSPQALPVSSSLAVKGLTADTTTDAFYVENGANTVLQSIDDAGNVSLGTGAGTSLGYTDIGSANQGGSGVDEISAQEVTTNATGGAITSMSAYIDGGASAPFNNYQFAIYQDNSGSPGNYLASSAIGTLGTAPAWYTLPINAVLQPSKTYWLVYWENDDLNDAHNGWSYNFPVGGAQNVSSSFNWQSGPDNGMPATFPAIQSGGAVQASLYATYATSGPALTISQFGALTQAGSVLLQDPTNSPSAFQVQDNAGNDLAEVDTAGDNVNLGATGSTAVSSTVNVGTSTGAPQTVNAGSSAGASTTQIQGGTGGVGISTGNVSGTSGTINIESGNSSTTSAGNVSLDAGSSTVNGTIIEDDTFESGTDNFGAWTGNSTTTVQNCTVAHSGSCSLAVSSLNGGAALENSGDFGTAVTPGHNYVFSVWIKADGSDNLSDVADIYAQTIWGTTGGWVYDNSPLTQATTSGWTHIQWTGIAPASTSYIDFVLGGPYNGALVYFDDVTATDLSSSATTALVSLGATNAQAVTLGNINELGATTIYGGSNINLNSGVSNINLVGGQTIVKPEGDNVSAFQIQDSSGFQLFTADTSNMKITINGSLTVTGNVTLDGHIVTGGSTPAIAAGAAACTTPTVGVVGNDTSGTITVTTGTGCAGNGTLATLTFATAFGATPHVSLTPDSLASLNLGAYNSGTSTTATSIGIANTPANSTAYSWDYQVLQ